MAGGQLACPPCEKHGSSSSSPFEQFFPCPAPSCRCGWLTAYPFVLHIPISIPVPSAILKYIAIPILGEYCCAGRARGIFFLPFPTCVCFCPPLTKQSGVPSRRV